MGRDDEARTVREDVETLERMGYAQELARRMSAFSNFAISLSIICILAGGITSFHVGFCTVGGAAVGVGWPLVCLFSLIVALTMGQVASAFPTAGGLYHWASILGGRGWGWLTAWFNLLGLVFVLAAINLGTYRFALGALESAAGLDLRGVGAGRLLVLQLAGVLAIAATQALFNHYGIRVTTRLTDFSGYLILAVAAALTGALLLHAGSLDLGRLVTFTNYSGRSGGGVIPERTDNIPWLFALSFLLPAYTMTGFDASAHTSEETVGAAVHVPRGIVRSVVVSGVFGWVMLCAVVLAMRDADAAAAAGDRVFYRVMEQALPASLAALLYVGIGAAQYLCGLAALTSTSRMAYAFARDGGLPFSGQLRRVNPRTLSPSVAVWTVAALAVLFTAYTPVYDTVAAACALFLYVSYVLPTALGLFAYGRSWTRMGPWRLGPLYRPLAAACVVGCGVLIAIGVSPPNDKNLWIVGGTLLALAALWFGVERRRFRGPPRLDVESAPADVQRR